MYMRAPASLFAPATPDIPYAAPAEQNLAFKWRRATIGPEWDGGAPFFPAGTTPALGAYTKPVGDPVGFAASPLAWAAQHVLKGMGDAAAPPTTPVLPGTEGTLTGNTGGAVVATGAVGAALLIAALAVSASAVAGFYAGKAMAPSQDKSSRWGVYGAVTAIFTGWLGLGIMGGVSLAQRNEL